MDQALSAQQTGRPEPHVWAVGPRGSSQREQTSHLQLVDKETRERELRAALRGGASARKVGGAIAEGRGQGSRPIGRWAGLPNFLVHDKDDNSFCLGDLCG